MPPAPRLSGSVSRLNCGLRRERGMVRTSTSCVTPWARSSSTSSSSARVACPIVQITGWAQPRGWTSSDSQGRGRERSRERIAEAHAFEDSPVGEVFAEHQRDLVETSRRPDLGDGSSQPSPDRKSTRLNSSHGYISYAVFCLKK